MVVETGAGTEVEVVVVETGASGVGTGAGTVDATVEVPDVVVCKSVAVAEEEVVVVETGASGVGTATTVWKAEDGDRENSEPEPATADKERIGETKMASEVKGGGGGTLLARDAGRD